MTISCVKILGYNLMSPSAEISNFEYVCQLLDQRIDPPTSEHGTLDVGDGIVFCSPLLRAKQCIMIKNDHKTRLVIREELGEIPFDLSLFCTAREWQRDGSKLVRQKFKDAFIDDKLVISRQTIAAQAKGILDICARELSPVIVSHTFRLTILRAIHETNGRIISEPELIHDYIQDDKKIMNFGERFTLKSD